jgi:MraZ protein
MAGFIGKELHSLDDKGRLMIPVKFRKKLDNQEAGAVLTLMKTMSDSIEMYEATAWKELQKKLTQLSDFNPDEKKLKTFINANLDEAELDKQGRVPIPKEFLEACAITKEVVIIGEGNKLSLWNPEKLKQALNIAPTEYETLTQKILG